MNYQSTFKIETWSLPDYETGDTTPTKVIVNTQKTQASEYGTIKSGFVPGRGRYCIGHFGNNPVFDDRSGRNTLFFQGVSYFDGDADNNDEVIFAESGTGQFYKSLVTFAENNNLL